MSCFLSQKETHVALEKEKTWNRHENESDEEGVEEREEANDDDVDDEEEEADEDEVE